MKINKKDMNTSVWIVLALTYFLPYQSKNEFSRTFGYPMPFFTTYDHSIGDTLVGSNALNIGGLAINILIVYLVIQFFKYLKQRYIKKT